MANRALIFALASGRAIKLQVGGGVRSKEVIEDLLAHGVDRVVVDSISVDEPRSVIAWLKRFGCERLCLAFDVRLDAFAVPRVRTRGWKRSTPLDLWRAIKPSYARRWSAMGRSKGRTLPYTHRRQPICRSWHGRPQAAYGTPRICRPLLPPALRRQSAVRPCWKETSTLRSYKHSC
jgi:hypothetical protein